MSAQTALSLRELCDRFEVTIVSEIPPERMSALGLRGVSNLGDAVRQAGDSRPWATAGILPEAFLTLSEDVECRIPATL